MKTQTVESQIIEQAVIALEKGQLVAFPTETVYGLGADATNKDALKRLYLIKERPHNHPVIVHLGSINELNRWAVNISDTAYALAEKFWPGPLTLILKRAEHVPTELTGGQDTIGLRIPNHPIALKLLQKFGKGIAAPSANKFGELSPTRAEDVINSLGKSIAVLINGGACTVGIESTIVDCTKETPVILRPGMLLTEHIAQVASNISFPSKQKPRDIRVSGSLPSHYAPKTPLSLVNTNQLEIVLAELLQNNKSACVLSLTPYTAANVIKNITASTDPVNYARDLYHNLHLLDAENSDIILVESVPANSAWIGIADRLERAGNRKDQ